MQAVQLENLSNEITSNPHYEDSFDAVRAASAIVFSTDTSSLPLEAQEASSIFSNSSFQLTVSELSKVFQKAVSKSALAGENIEALASFIAAEISSLGREQTWEANLLISIAGGLISSTEDEDVQEASKLFFSIGSQLANC